MCSFWQGLCSVEEKIEGVDGHVLSEKIRTSGHKNVVFAPNKEDAAEKVLNLCREGDVVITLGAGDIYKIGKRLKASVEWTGIKGQFSAMFQ